MTRCRISAQVGDQTAYDRYLANILQSPGARRTAPFVTVFTPAYRTGTEYYAPVPVPAAVQTYTNWEWIIVDDSDDHEGETFALLTNIARKDHRVQVFKPGEHSGDNRQGKELGV